MPPMLPHLYAPGFSCSSYSSYYSDVLPPPRFKNILKSGADSVKTIIYMESPVHWTPTLGYREGVQILSFWDVVSRYFVILLPFYLLPPAANSYLNIQPLGARRQQQSKSRTPSPPYLPLLPSSCTPVAAR